jgi:hypothetical protein
VARGRSARATNRGNNGDALPDGSDALAAKVRENPLGSLVIADATDFALALLMARPARRPLPPGDTTVEASRIFWRYACQLSGAATRSGATADATGKLFSAPVCNRLGQATFAKASSLCRMIPRAEECRRKAKEAEAKAETTRDQAAREMLREVAELWRKLADQVEQRGW